MRHPTLVEVCALPKATGLDGVSLAPILADPAATVREAALSQHPRPAYYKTTAASPTKPPRTWATASVPPRKKLNKPPSKTRRSPR